MSLILTLQVDPEAQAHFETLRQRHFPPERNLIPAHLTLFHQLPDAAATIEILERLAEEQIVFDVRVTGLRSLGKGVSYTLASQTLTSLHSRLARVFQDDLIAQDRQRFQPHIVVQNKVTPEAARALLAELQQGFVPSNIHAHGLDLWRYLDGPWEYLRAFPFRANPDRGRVRIGI